MGGGEKKCTCWEKRKHNLIPALFELGTTCSLLKQLVWLFIISLLAAITHARGERERRVARRNVVDVFLMWSYSPAPELSTLKGFHFADVMTCEMSHQTRWSAREMFSGNCVLFDWHFGKRAAGNLAIIAVT